MFFCDKDKCFIRQGFVVRLRALIIHISPVKSLSFTTVCIMNCKDVYSSTVDISSKQEHAMNRKYRTY